MIRKKCDNCGTLFDYFPSQKKRFCSYQEHIDMKRKNTTHQDFFSSIDNEERSYWFGFLYADGSVTSASKKQKCVVLELATKDVDHVNRFASLFNSKVSKTKRDSVKCTVTSTQMWNDLVSNGVCPNKTRNFNDKILRAVKTEF